MKNSTVVVAPTDAAPSSRPSSALRESRGLDTSRPLISSLRTYTFSALWCVVAVVVVDGEHAWLEEQRVDA